MVAINLLITGADGFIGKNLVARLKQAGQRFSLQTFTRGQTYAELEEKIKKCDVIIHIAGVNRADKEADFIKGNAELTEKLAIFAQSSNRKLKIIFSSSIHAGKDGAYGLSKALAEDKLLALQKNNKINLAILRLPHLFGKWSRPNYNSVVSTFCNNIINGKPNKIDDPSVILDLLYIDDLMEIFHELIRSDEKAWPENIIIENFPTHSISLGDLHQCITQFHQFRQRLHVNNVGAGLERALYATYLSFLPKENFSYSIPKYSDDRGDFIEMVKTPGAGQVSYFTAQVGVIRGRHYHHTKSEKFLVVQGTAVFRFHQVVSNEKYEIFTNSAKPEIVETIPGWAHEIENIGTELLIILVWANEVFDQEKPDTFNFCLLDNKD